MLIHHRKRGFTLIEILLSLSLIVLLASVGTPVYQELHTRNNLDVATNSIVQTLRRAQVLSVAVDGDTSWGVSVQSGAVVLFRGTSYATRDVGYDEVFEVTTAITPSGIGEIVFTEFTGEPDTTGTITLTSHANEVRNITINEKGTVTF